MKFDRICRASAAVRPCLALLPASCSSPFRAREVDLERRSEEEAQSYYRFTAGSGDRLSFESRNFFSSNLLMPEFFDDEEKLVRRLAVRQELEPSRMLLSVLSDVCFQLAQRTSDRDAALRYDLAAIYEVRRILLEHLKAEGVCKTAPPPPLPSAETEKTEDR